MLRSGSKTRSQYLGLSKRNFSPRSSDDRSTPTSFRTPTPNGKRKSKGRIGPTTTEPFSEQEIIDLKTSFRSLDVDGEGRISVSAYRNVLEALLEEEAERPYPHLREILRVLAGRPDGDTLDFDDYLDLMASVALPRRLPIPGEGEDGKPDFTHVFNLFDVDGKGYITVEDLRRVALELGENDMTMEELEEMVHRARSRKTGKVTLKEFSKMMMLNLFRRAGDTTDDEHHQPEEPEQGTK